MKRFKKVLSSIIASTMVFSLTACGNNSKESSVSNQPANEPVKSSNPWLEKAALAKEDNVDQLYEEAKKEGKVVVYSMSSRIKDIKTTFEKKYPGVTLEGYDMRMAEIFEKVQRENQAGVNNADFIFVKDSDGAVYNEFIKTKILYNYIPKDIGSKIEQKAFKDPEFSPFFEMKQIFYNTEVNQTSPIDSWWDLTRPEYKGKVMIANPASTAENMGVFLAMIQNADDMAKAYKEEFGEDIKLNGTENAGYEFIKRLAANDLILTTSDTDIVKAIGAAGQKNPSVGIATSSKIREKSTGLKIGVVQNLKPRDGVMAPAMMLVVDKAPHINAAKLLIRFMAGEADGKAAGFDPFRVEGSWPTRSDISVIGTQTINSLKLWNLDLDFDYNNRTKLNDFWLSIQK
jgi:iron(III) transport system substrate-binding protein